MQILKIYILTKNAVFLVLLTSSPNSAYTLIHTLSKA